MSHTPRSRRRRTVAITGAAVLAMSTLAIPSTGNAATTPTLRLVSASEHHILTSVRGNPVPLDLGLYIASPEGDFELRSARPDYDTPFSLTQWVDGVEDRTLDPALAPPESGGLADFLHIQITSDRTGDVVTEIDTPFCPAGYVRQRVNDSGPINSRYPFTGCSGMPFTLGSVWGIDEGWATTPFEPYEYRLDLKQGHYTAEVTVNDPYAALFGFPPDADSATVMFKIDEVDCYDYYGYGCGRDRRRAESATPSAPVPDDTTPDPATLPDLISLPAWEINLQTRGKGQSRREYLSFGANVWDAGSAPLAVEGFRDPGDAFMTGYQYFYDGDSPVGRAEVGEFEFDQRDGHDHWHFKQFAKYALLDRSMSLAVRSEKEAFCLAPTDAIDLTKPGAEWQPDSVGLDTACGGHNALWIREILPAGWGDTYGQYLPGQAFDVTNLPNGRYYVEITANPDGVLYETDDTNNVSLRRVILRGRPGERRVAVPPWHGIDTH